MFPSGGVVTWCIPSLRRAKRGHKFPGFSGTTMHYDFLTPVSPRSVGFARRYVPLPCSRDPGGPDASGRLRCGGVAPAVSKTKASALKLSRLSYTASALAAGAVRSMVGFAGRVTPPPRKTRFRPLARRYRAGLVTRGAAIKGFRNHVMLFILLLQASCRKDIHPSGRV